MTDKDYPIGTVAVSERGVVYIRISGGGWATVVYRGGKWVDDRYGRRSVIAVAHVIQLGEARPKTLADCPGEAWMDGDGHAMLGLDQSSEGVSIIAWKDGTISSYNHAGEIIQPNWTHLGKVDGITITGKDGVRRMWPETRKLKEQDDES